MTKKQRALEIIDRLKEIREELLKMKKELDTL